MFPFTIKVEGLHLIVMKKQQNPIILIGQHIMLSWKKDCRGAPFSTIRNRTKQSYPLPDSFYKKLDCIESEFPCHFLYFRQEKDGIYKVSEQIQSLNRNNKWKTGLEIIETSEKKNYPAFTVYFSYSQNMGQPTRNYSYHKKAICEVTDYPDYLFQLLREPAFSLEPGIYGRILYNGRFTDFDTGGWWYELHIFNLTLSDKLDNSHLFTCRNPDITYQQLASFR